MRPLPSMFGGSALIFVAGLGLAQQATPLAQFNPAPAGDWSFGVESPDVRGAEPLRANLVLDYAHEPLVLRAEGERVGAAISHRLLVHPGVSYALATRLLLSLSVPIPLVLSGEDPADSETGVSIQSPSGAEFGDVRLGARVRLLELPPTRPNLALSAQVWLPTGTRDSYVNDEAVRASFSAIAGAMGPRFSWSVQPGIIIRKQRFLPSTSAPPVGTALTLGAALGYRVLPAQELVVGAEVHAHNVLVGEAQMFDDLGAELLAEIKVRPGRGVLELGVAAGPGLTTTPGVPELRVLASLTYSRPGESSEFVARHSRAAGEVQ